MKPTIDHQESSDKTQANAAQPERYRRGLAINGPANGNGEADHQCKAASGQEADPRAWPSVSHLFGAALAVILA